MLDRAEALRAKRRAALAQLDSLTQSLFLDLFGDPVAESERIGRSRALRSSLTCKRTTNLTVRHVRADGDQNARGFNTLTRRRSFGRRYFVRCELATQRGPAGDRLSKVIVVCASTSLTHRGKLRLHPRTSIRRSSAGTSMSPSIRRKDCSWRYLRSCSTPELEPGRSIATMPASTGATFDRLQLTEICANCQFPFPPSQLQREFARRVASGGEAEDGAARVAH